jgi:hypothetical protein
MVSLFPSFIQKLIFIKNIKNKSYKNKKRTRKEKLGMDEDMEKE